MAKGTPIFHHHGVNSQWERSILSGGIHILYEYIHNAGERVSISCPARKMEESLCLGGAGVLILARFILIGWRGSLVASEWRVIRATRRSQPDCPWYQQR